MRNLIDVCLVLAIATIPAAYGQPGSGQPVTSLDALTAVDWRHDLGVFSEQLVQTHRSPFHHTPRDRFEAAISELDQAIPSLQAHEITVGFMRLGAMIGDTHSRVGAPQLKVIPIEVEWFADELRITRASPEFRDLLGARLLQIGNLSVPEAQRRIVTVISQEVNESFERLFSPFFLRNADILHALRITAERQRVPLLVEKDDDRRSVTLEATVTAGQASQARDWIDYAPSAAEPPLHRRDTQKNWITYLEKSGVAYFAFNRYGDDKSLQAFSQELAQFLREKRPKRLVVDMRNNPGGDFGLGRWYIIRTVMRSSHLLTHGRLFVAVDRSSFSAAFINALDFRRDANAILVGEPPGERPWAYGDGSCNKLPRSGLLACFSTRFYRMTDDDAATIPLDHRVVLTWADFVAGQDPIMDWILAQPEPMDPLPLRVPQK